jgi:hypothetical protein
MGREWVVSAIVIARVAVVPHPPLLVPELVGGHDSDAQAIREACVAVAGQLAGAARSWVAIGADGTAGIEQPWSIGPDAVGTFRGYGVDVAVRLAAAVDGRPDPAMPLPALVAGWLRGQVGACQVQVWLVPPDLPTPDCAAAGELLFTDLAGDEQVGLLVLGDGSHRHGRSAVGRADRRATAFDEQVRQALAAADPAALLDLDAGLAGALGAVGRAPWQVLAGVIGKDGREWRCVEDRLLIPFGVAYHLAVWDPV